MNRLELLLDKISEECSEITKVTCKAKQFGLGGFDPLDPNQITNLQALRDEFNDLLGTIELLNTEYETDIIPDRAKIDAKKVKINHFARFSNKPTLDPEIKSTSKTD